jgi:hypothetical protein
VLEKIDLRLDESRAGQIFSIADANKSNDLDLDEFCVAMRLLELEIANQYVCVCVLVRVCLACVHSYSRSALQSLGLSTTALVGYAITLICALALLLVFVLLGIGALTTNTSFGAVVNTLLPISAGGALFASGGDVTSDISDAIAAPESSKFGRAVSAALDFLLKPQQQHNGGPDDEDAAADS